jgi:perosamine synthetase
MIPFAKPSLTPELRAEMFSLIEAAIESGMLTNSENVREVESFFEESLGMHVAATNSCTASLHLAMLLIGIQENDEVIVPSDTFVSTANAVLYCGGKPVFAEIEEDSWTLSPDSILENITQRTKAIIPVHLGGVPCDMDAIMDIAEDHHLAVVEDCAHAHGALLREQPCGSFGDISCFSFYPTKVIAGPEGGLIACKENELKSKASILINQGRASSGPSEITEIGYNYRMNELQAIMIRVQIQYLSEIIKVRTELARQYEQNLKNSNTLTLVKIPASSAPSYYSYSVLINEKDRDSVAIYLQEKGIGTSIMYHPVHLQPVYKRIFGYEPGELPITEDICSRTISLPLHLNVTASDVKFICHTLLEYLE